MKINLVIGVLVLVIVALSATLWWSLGTKPAPLPTVSSAQPTKMVAPAVPEPPALRPATHTTPTLAPVASLSERDKKYLRHGIDPSVVGHKISVTVTK